MDQKEIMRFYQIINQIHPKVAFVYGSEIYGTGDDDSDIDCTFVCNVEDEYTDQQFDLHCITEGQFLQKLDDHDIQVLEGLSLQFHDEYKHKYYYGEPFEFTINKKKLRHSISQIASNSFVKAKKKIVVPEDRDLRVSMKSLFHAIRIYEFGAQIAEFGYVRNFQSCNELYKSIIIDYDTVKDDAALISLIREKYKPIFNEYATKFRALCPKQ